MAHLQNNDRFNGVLKVATLLIFIGTSATLILGTALNSVNAEQKTLTQFLASAENLRTDFEQSLIMYTESTKEDISFLHSLRPNTEIEYIAFIDSVEDLAKELSININLESISQEKTSTTNIQSNSLDYEISFYGSKKQLFDLLEGLESMPYYVHVLNIDYTSLSSMDEDSKNTPNINLVIKLYVK